MNDKHTPSSMDLFSLFVFAPLLSSLLSPLSCILSPLNSVRFFSLSHLSHLSYPRRGMEPQVIAKGKSFQAKFLKVGGADDIHMIVKTLK